MATLKEKSEQILTEKELKIIPENIRKDTQIFDIVGEYEGQVINNQDKTITSNGTYQADQGYTGLGEVTVNVSGGGGSGDVKLFDTIEHMQADPSPEDGDLAIVYRSEISNWQEDTEAQIITFPDTVTLPTAFTGSIYGMFRGTDTSMWFDAQIQLSSSRFDFNAYGEEGEIYVRYSSSDGITYTKTQGDDSVDCGTPIVWEPYEEWNNAIGYFMQTGGKYFEGMFEYGYYTDPNCYDFIKNIKTSSDLDTESVEITPELKNILLRLKDNIPASLSPVLGATQIRCTIVKTGETTYDVYTALYKDASTGVTMFDDSMPGLYIDSTNRITWFCLGCGAFCDAYIVSNLNDTSYANSKYVLITYHLDLSDNSITSRVLDASEFTSYKTSRNYTHYKSINAFSNDYAFASIVYYITNDNLVITSQRYTSTIVSSGHISIKNTVRHIYIPAKTQLDATASDVYAKSFYGKNGIAVGTLGTNPSNLFDDAAASIIYSANEAYAAMSPLKITAANKNIISDNIRFIPVNSQGEALLDVSELTDVQSLFADKIYLKDIPCEFGNVYYMSSMCNGCSNLITFPYINATNSQHANYLCYNCTNLKNVPAMDFANTNTWPNAFSGCPNLSNESLNNILAICISATKSETKTLKYIGLSSTQATTCTTLSNWPACQAAGWTTGY